VWNRDKRFTGWTDIELSERGGAQARAAGRLLAAHGCRFDLCFTSCLRRASETLRLVLETMGCPEVPVERCWRLNERHYGALQGLSHWEAVRRYGARRMLAWQKGFAVPPPPLDPADPRFPGRDPRYAGIDAADLPVSESLRDTHTRLLPCWRDAMAPALRAGRRVLVVAHRNSLRVLMAEIESLREAEVLRLRVPTGEPLVYELDADLTPLRRHFLRRGGGLWQRAAEVFR
jgi:2,3-bisphosphoglycerate-dependent phosphoglycerate mutase